MSKTKSADDLDLTFTHVDPSPPSYCEADSDSIRVLRPFTSGAAMPTEARADRLRDALRQRLLDFRLRRKPLNVLLVGPAGVGKSCFLNSAIRAFRKEWGQYVQTGGSAGEGRTNITAYLRRVNLVDPGEDDPDRLGPGEVEEDEDEEVEVEEGSDAGASRRAKKQEETLRRVATRFVDVCGLPNENNHVTREVLRRLLYGAIPLEENVLDVHALGDKDGAAAIRERYPTGDDKLAIDRVVVVNAANMEAPKDLIKAITEAAQPITESSQEDGINYKRSVPVFGLITKRDLVDRMGDDQVQQYDRMRSSLIDLLALRGAATRFSECQNYFTELGDVPGLDERVNDPRVDCPILQFIYDLADPNVRVDHPHFRPDIPGSEVAPEPEAIGPEVVSGAAAGRQVAGEGAVQQGVFGQYGVAVIILALSVYIGVLLHFDVLSKMISASPVAFIPAALLTLAPILFLIYVVYSGDRRFI